MSGTGIFLQARLDSERLPRKVLLPIMDKTVLEHCMAALRRVPASVYVILTDKASASVLHRLGEAYGFHLLAGSDEDVLSRYAAAVHAYKVDTVIRATADNPLVSWELARKLLQLHWDKEADYSGFLDMPLGLGVEAIDADALLKAHCETENEYEREHVTPFLYDREDTFRVLRPSVEKKYFLPEGRVTLDTKEDYNYITTIFRDLYRGSPIDVLELIGWLRSKAFTLKKQKIFL